jgi:hypothetical protein
MKNINDLVDESIADIQCMKENWIKANKINPEMFPMEFDDDNEGGFFESIVEAVLGDTGDEFTDVAKEGDFYDL